MSTIDRIVKRNTLKAKLAELEQVIRTSRPIMAAQNMMQHIYREGYAAGYSAGVASCQKTSELKSDAAKDNCIVADEQPSSPAHDAAAQAQFDMENQAPLLNPECTEEEKHPEQDQHN